MKDNDLIEQTFISTRRVSMNSNKAGKDIYIDQEFYEGLTGTSLEELGYEEQFQSALFTACEIINAGCGNIINSTGLENLSEFQQISVKKATVFLVEHYLTRGNINPQLGSFLWRDRENLGINKGRYRKMQRI